MANISVAEILKIHGKWIQAKDLTRLVSEKLKITERHAYTMIKKALGDHEILREELQSGTVLYGLAEFGPTHASTVFKSRHQVSQESKTFQHYKTTVKTIRPYLENPYRLLRFFESGELYVLFPEFAGHLESGYPDLYSLFERFKNLPEKVKVCKVDEEEVCNVAEKVVTGETADPVDDIGKEVYNKLRYIVTVVENGGALRGSCDFCPDRIPNEE